MSEDEVRRLEDSEFIRQCGVYEKILLKRIRSGIGNLTYNLELEATAYLIDGIKLIVMDKFSIKNGIGQVQLGLTMFEKIKDMVLHGLKAKE